MELDTLLAQMIERNASDLHIAVGVPPVFRADGALVAVKSSNLTSENVDALLQTSLPADKLAGAHQGNSFAVTLRYADRIFRCRVFRERDRLAAAVRILPDQIPSIHGLRLPPVLETLTQCKSGLILLAGPTGSGKTTTLVSLVDHINLNRAARIHTVEDPMHYFLPTRLSLVTQCVVGEDIESYERGLLSVMDADPDVVLIGELRTPETARLALELAEIGTLVFSQITADTVADALARLVGMLGESQDLARRLVARTVRAVIAQNLLRREDSPGRVAANEILITTARVRQMIADGQTDPNLLAFAMEASHRFGMQTMDDALISLHASGIISRESAEGYLKEKGRLPSG